MKVGFYSPLPPAPTGVADYSAALLEALRPLGTVEVDAADCDIALYHVGNNALHREIYLRTLARPGVVVLHDALLQHFYLGMLDEAAYVEEFVFNYGEWSRDLARDLWAGRARSGADPRYFGYPMLKRIAQASSGDCAQSCGGETRLRTRAGCARGRDPAPVPPAGAPGCGGHVALPGFARAGAAHAASGHVRTPAGNQAADGGVARL